MKTVLKSTVAAAALAAPLFAATPPDLVVGNPPSTTPNQGISNANAPFTVIDATRPATATGNLTQVKLAFGSSCSSAVRIKVFHRTGATVTPTGQTPPLGLSSPDADGIFTLALSPALPVQEGDLIGMAVLTTCGYVEAYHFFPTAGYYEFPGDVNGPVTLDTPVSTSQLALGATGVTTSYTAIVVPGVGSLPGAQGAHFKTSLQVIANPYGGDLSGKLVFHPIGVSGSTSDPSIALVIGAGRAVAYPDVMATIGQTGIGSLDVVLDAASPAPVVYARVFNDAGAAGTSGLGEPAIDVSQPGYLPGSLVMSGGCTGLLSAPVDPATQRINIGMRSLDTDVTISFTLKSEDGATRASALQTLSPNEFLQVKAEDLFGGTAPGANDYIQVSVSGASIVYGATTDNTTNDPSVQFVTPIGCVA